MFARIAALPDRLLNRVTMYRLVIYYLGGLLGIAALECWQGRLDYPVTAVLGTAAVAVGVCAVVNALFSATFGAPRNEDSAIITGLILALIVGPAMTERDYVFVAWAATLAMASKYILAWRRLHLFNPAAIAAVATALFANQTASWWVGTKDLTPFVIAGGVLLVRKIRRSDVVLSFLWATFFTTFALTALDGVPFTQELQRGVLGSPVWFIAFVMLTEPVTLPSTKAWQMAYGVLAGVLIAPQVHWGEHYLTPELGLLIANVCALPIRSRQKRLLVLDRAMVTGPGLMDFFYVPIPPLAYQPGQYMEWTLEHVRPDSRGKRRYFTLASSPTERALRVGVKFADRGSSYKSAMLDEARPGTTIIAAQVAGDFTLPRNPDRKLAFIAGGIGITPFRSMVKYLVDRRERRDIVLLYANRRWDEILYWDVWQASCRVLRFRPVFVLSDPTGAPASGVEHGRIDRAMIARQVPDYRERTFYVSGSSALVHSTVQALRDLGVKPDRIKTDHFTGLAA